MITVGCPVALRRPEPPEAKLILLRLYFTRAEEVLRERKGGGLLLRPNNFAAIVTLEGFLVILIMDDWRVFLKLLLVVNHSRLH